MIGACMHPCTCGHFDWNNTQGLQGDGVYAPNTTGTNGNIKFTAD